MWCVQEHEDQPCVFQCKLIIIIIIIFTINLTVYHSRLLLNLVHLCTVWKSIVSCIIENLLPSEQYCNFNKIAFNGNQLLPGTVVKSIQTSQTQKQNALLSCKLNGLNWLKTCRISCEVWFLFWPFLVRNRYCFGLFLTEKNKGYIILEIL